MEYPYRRRGLVDSLSFFEGLSLPKRSCAPYAAARKKVAFLLCDLNKRLNFPALPYAVTLVLPSVTRSSRFLFLPASLTVNGKKNPELPFPGASVPFFFSVSPCSSTSHPNSALVLKDITSRILMAVRSGFLSPKILFDLTPPWRRRPAMPAQKGPYVTLRCLLQDSSSSSGPAIQTRSSLFSPINRNGRESGFS